MSGLPVYGFPPQFPGFQEQFRADLTGGGGMPSLDPRLVRQMSQGSSFGSPVGMGSLMGDAVISPDGSLGPAERPVPSRVPPWMDVQKQATAGAGLGPRPELPMAMAGPGGTEGSPLRSGEAGPMGGEQVALRRAGPLAPPAGAPRPLDAGIIGMPRETQDRMDQMEGEFDAARAKARADTEAAVAANNLAAQQRREERIKDIRSWGSSGAGAGPMQTEDLSLAPQRAAQPVRRFPAPSAPAEEQYKSVDPSVMGKVIGTTGAANAEQAKPYHGANGFPSQGDMQTYYNNMNAPGGASRGATAPAPAAQLSAADLQGMSYQDMLAARQSAMRTRKAEMEDPNNPAGAEHRAMMEAARARGEYLRAGGDPKALPPMTYRGAGRPAVDPAAQQMITQAARQREADYRARQEQSRMDRGLMTTAQQNQMMTKRGMAEKDFRDARLGYSPPVTYIPPWLEAQQRMQQEAMNQDSQRFGAAQQLERDKLASGERIETTRLTAADKARQEAMAEETRRFGVTSGEAIETRKQRALDQAAELELKRKAIEQQAAQGDQAAQIAIAEMDNKAGRPIDPGLRGRFGGQPVVPGAPAQAEPAAIRDVKQQVAQGKEKTPFHVLMDSMNASELTPERIAELKQIYGEKPVSEYGRNLWSRSPEVDEKMKRLGVQPTDTQLGMRMIYGATIPGMFGEQQPGQDVMSSMLFGRSKPRVPPPGMVK